MSLERLHELEMIDPTPLPPWQTGAFSSIEIEPDRETAIKQARAARSKSDVIVYSDASGRHGHLGAAAIGFHKNSPEAIKSLQTQVGPMDRWAVHAAKLLGVLYAITLINKIAVQRRRSMETRAKTATILSDSMSALQAIQNPGNKSGQQIIHTILRTATNTKTHGIAVRLQWVPGHCDEPGNDTADTPILKRKIVAIDDGGLCLRKDLNGGFSLCKNHLAIWEGKRQFQCLEHGRPIISDNCLAQMTCEALVASIADPFNELQPNGYYSHFFHRISLFRIKMICILTT
jgi:ribonuclease HI